MSTEDLIGKVWERLEPVPEDWSGYDDGQRRVLRIVGQATVWLDPAKQIIYKSIGIKWLYEEDGLLRGPEAMAFMLQEMTKEYSVRMDGREGNWDCDHADPKGGYFSGATLEEAVTRCWLEWKEKENENG